MPGVLPRPDPYDVLGLPADATTEQVREAHRRLARAVHPDTGGSAALFTTVQQAYEVLLDPSSVRLVPAPLASACRCGAAAVPAGVPAPVAEVQRPPLAQTRRPPVRHDWAVEGLLALQLTLLGLAALVLLLH